MQWGSNVYMDKIHKLLLPVIILIASIVLGGFYYSVQIKKQKSIEQQQERSYIAERKKDCYELFEKEREQWNNVINFAYFEPDENPFSMYSDICEIEYKDNKTGENFSKFY